jgi:peptidoglycan/LPS O-acetylase OafA/YrhL
MKAPTTTSLHRYAVLDGVRGTAILYVTFSHISNWWDKTLFRGGGEFGVWLFFVLSAFLLSLYFFVGPGKISSPKEWLNYFMRRFLRIYPIYLLALVLGAILHEWWSFAAIPSLLLLRDLGPWAIYVEFKFYFALPLLIILVQLLGIRYKIMPLLLLVAYAIGYRWMLPHGHLQPGYDAYKMGNWLVVEYTPLFVAGTVAAWYYANLTQIRQHAARSRLLDFLLFAALLFPIIASPDVANWLLGTKLKLDYYHLNWTPWGFFFAAYIFGLMLSDGLTKRLLSSRLFRFFGFVSYSTYLFQDYWIGSTARLFTQLNQYLGSPVGGPHSQWNAQVGGPGNLPWVSIPVELGLIFLTSYLLFFFIERPLSRISLIKRTQPTGRDPTIRRHAPMHASTLVP